MRTTCRIQIQDARQLALPPGSVQLVVTSPPYPMIEMWDAPFRAMSQPAADALDDADGAAAFEAMHAELDAVWAACAAALSPGGIACINVGDATRTIGGDFQLYPNHARVLQGCVRAGLTPLPDILWRKPTNAPNKFMGSGMLPGGAYVTYEHEYVLVLRKGSRRVFKTASQRSNRRRSAYFWEERNRWFSDLWQDLPGASQRLSGDAKKARARSGAFPLSLAHRLVSMYSAYGDTVLDPFAGTGTTLLAAASSGRSSVGCELDPELLPAIRESVSRAPASGAARVRSRLAAHAAFVAAREAVGKKPKHHNAPHDVAVVTRQETALELLAPSEITETAPGEWALSFA